MSVLPFLNSIPEFPGLDQKLTLLWRGWDGQGYFKSADQALLYAAVTIQSLGSNLTQRSCTPRKWEEVKLALSFICIFIYFKNSFY